MRVPQLSQFVPNYRLAWSRITTTRSTLFYFLLAVIHCIVQVVFQVIAFQINSAADDVLRYTIDAADLTNSYAILESNGPMRLCENVVRGVDLDTCPIVWTGTGEDVADTDGDGDMGGAYDNGPSSSGIAAVIPASASPTPTPTPGKQLTVSAPTRTPTVTTVTVTSTRAAGSGPTGTVDAVVPVLRKRSLTFDPSLNSTTGQLTGVEITGLEGQSGPVVAPLQCVQVLIWPRQLLRQSKRQDVVFISFQIWTLGISLVALFNESIPHVIAALLTHVVTLTWSAGQLGDTAHFKSEFGRLTVDGACRGLNLLPQFWTPRGTAEIVVLVVDAVTLVGFAYLTWRLVKQFGWQTFKRVGASIVINRCYKFVLALSILLQLAFFAIVASMGLWLDLQWNSVLGLISIQSDVYKGVYIAIYFVLIPWILLGWFSVRRELLVPMISFLFITLVLLGGWAGMMASTTYRITFRDWSFFSILSVFAASLTFLSGVLGVVCFCNFGNGLPKYLKAREPLEDGSDDEEEQGGEYDEKRDIEKGFEEFRFPASRPVPTYAIEFGYTGGGAAGPASDLNATHVSFAPDNGYTPTGLGPGVARSKSGSSTNSTSSAGHSTIKTAATSVQQQESRRQLSGSASLSSNGATSTKRWLIE